MHCQAAHDVHPVSLPTARREPRLLPQGGIQIRPLQAWKLVSKKRHHPKLIVDPNLEFTLLLLLMKQKELPVLESLERHCHPVITKLLLPSRDFAPVPLSFRRRPPAAPGKHSAKIKISANIENAELDQVATYRFRDIPIWPNNFMENSTQAMMFLWYIFIKNPKSMCIYYICIYTCIYTIQNIYTPED